MDGGEDLVVGPEWAKSTTNLIKNGVIEKYIKRELLSDRIYTRKIEEDLVRRLYKLKQYYRRPMTKIANMILAAGISALEEKIHQEQVNEKEGLDR